MGWVLVEDKPDIGMRVWECDMGDHTIIKTEHYVANDFFEANKVEFNESASHRWKDGRVVGHVPLHTLFRELGGAIKDGDEKYITKWLNDPDRRRFRTFEGEV